MEPKSGKLRRKRRGESPAFGIWAVVFQCVALILFGLFVGYSDSSSPANNNNNNNNNLNFKDHTNQFTSIHTFLFIGLALYGCWLQQYGLSSIGFTLFLGATSIELSILFESFWTCSINKAWKYIQLDVTSFIRADMGAVSLLVSLGSCIGILSTNQMLFVTLFEIFFHSLNRSIISDALLSMDIGGSMSVFVFGSIFGLSLSKILTLKTAHKQSPNTTTTTTTTTTNNNVSSIILPRTRALGGDLLSMIGAGFIWIHFLGFNSSLCPSFSSQERALVHTCLSLIGSCTSAFAFSQWLRPGHRFSVSDIISASLAGGSAMGSTASLAVWPAGALTIGVCSGLVSIYSEAMLRPFLHRKFGIIDSSATLSTFCLPGLIGAIAASITSSFAKSSVYGSDEINLLFPAILQGHSASSQAGLQIAALGTTIFIAMISGLFTGFVISAPIFRRGVFTVFDDKQHWQIVTILPKPQSQSQQQVRQEKIATNSQSANTHTARIPSPALDQNQQKEVPLQQQTTTVVTIPQPQSPHHNAVMTTNYTTPIQEKALVSKQQQQQQLFRERNERPPSRASVSDIQRTESGSEASPTDEAQFLSESKVDGPVSDDEEDAEEQNENESGSGSHIATGSRTPSGVSRSPTGSDEEDGAPETDLIAPKL